MATLGVNLAVTKDGETYNKLKRPDDYLLSPSPHPPHLAVASPSAFHSGKRKREQDGAAGSKRARAERNSTGHSAGSKGRFPSSDPAREYGMRTMLPGLDAEDQLSDDSTSEAVAYLHSVRSEASTIPTLLVAPTGQDTADSDFGDDKGPVCTNTGDGQRVVYKEGTWIAVDDRNDAATDHWHGGPYDVDAQESCHKLLLKRFRSFRNKLVEADNGDSVNEVLADFGDSERAGQPSTRQAWADIVDRDYPVLHEVIRMDDRTLYLALQGCALALGQSATISRKKSCWIWTLLALAGDFGTLDHERVSRIRDLGLRAGRLGTRLRQGIVASKSNDNGIDTGVFEISRLKTERREVHDCNEKIAGEGSKDVSDTEYEASGGMATDSQAAKADRQLSKVVNDQGDGAHIMDGDASESEAEMVISDNGERVDDVAEDTSLEQARARLLAQLGDRLVHSGIPLTDQLSNNRATGPKDMESAALSDSDWNTKVAIDMILTVVAECYGQRDLLRFREAW
ncbi:hypothetical protein EJ02DRAFT_449831 [Clathrospora elynae]|uniref:Uncharacterized protein n=1 Tax=Clathrospora elynae TaxID=706981 RepID=A0A6A5T4Y2_9PLEO|nr:hypothetical protein EJ02DRAFT_449831 [Clathrospora elynae]